MISKKMKDIFGDGIRYSPDPEGIDLGGGNIKTARGTIRVPKKESDKIKKEHEQALSFSEYTPKETIEVKPVKQEIKLIPMLVYTEVGVITINCKEINDTGEFLIVGLNDSAFSPKSYKEDPNTLLDIEVNGNRANYVFIGCKWKQEATNTVFVVLMKR